MKRRIILRADASKKIGFGHFYRMLALADYLKEDFMCYFYSFNADGIGVNLIGNKVRELDNICRYVPIGAPSLDDFNLKFLDFITPDDIVVLDNYYYSTEFQLKIKDIGCKLVCVDDMHDRHMVCDLLMTPSPFSRNDFSLEPYTKFAGGIEWAFLREPFFQPEPDRNFSTEIKRIVIAMGGSDAFNLTEKMVNSVNKTFPQAKIDVISGNTSSTQNQYRGILNIHQNISAEKIVNIFDSADLGIFPASTVCIEAFSRKLPVAAGFYADNQIGFYNYGVDNHLFIPLGCLLDEKEDLDRRLDAITGKITNGYRPERIEFDFIGHKEKTINLFREL